MNLLLSIHIKEHKILKHCPLSIRVDEDTHVLQRKINK